jgi:hypothetical protein
LNKEIVLILLINKPDGKQEVRKFEVPIPLEEGETIVGRIEAC